MDGEAGAQDEVPVVLDLPFRGRWLARNSPARRVPSHGTDLFGVTYAIDFIAVDERGWPAPRTWRTALAVEPPEAFRGFGALGRGGPFVLLAHLRRGTMRVAPGESVSPGQQLGECGNSGNSTQPHVHVQVTDSTDWPHARGLPMAFRRRSPSSDPPAGSAWLPRESEIVDAGPP